jgi:asparagine N-glycosylation enzyme membrane subunit Stt3
MALVRQFAWPVFAVLVTDFVMMLFGVEEMGNEAGFWIGLWVCCMGLLVFNLVALVHFGMWQGVTQRRLNRASGNTVALVVVVPWVLLVMLLMLVAVLRIQMPGQQGGYWVLGIYILLQAGIDMLVLGWSSTLLHGALQRRAFRRGEPD